MRSLARRGDTDGLIDAVYYEDRQTDLVGNATDFGEPVREDAVRALAAAGPETAGLAVADALTDSSDRVRSAAVGAFALWGDSTMLATAVGDLPADQGHARRLALLALERLARPGSACALTRVLVHADGDEPLRSSDVESVFRVLAAEERHAAVDEVIDVLKGALDGTHEAVGERAADLLTRLAPTSIEAVTMALSHAGLPRAASVLGRIGDRSALEPLLEALTHPDPCVRAESCVALGELRSPSSVEALLSAADDNDPVVRKNAGAALDRIGAAGVIVGIAAVLRPALETLADAVSDRDGPESARRNVTGLCQ